MKQIYKITYLPTEKIYIGKVAYESFRYFGSPDIEVVNEDFRKLPKEVQKKYSVTKEILWESEDCSDSELAEKEVEFICKFQSNDPAIGYNRWPKFRQVLDQEELGSGEEMEHPHLAGNGSKGA